MKIKFYVFLLSMCVSRMSFAGSYTLPTYTLSYVSANHSNVQARISGRTIYVNIANPAVDATLLGLYFNSNPNNATYSLTGVGTITGNGSQDYKNNTQLSVIFSNGTVTKYTIKVTKDLPPTLPPAPNNNVDINNFKVTLLSGLYAAEIPNSRVIISYNKIICTIPANLSITSFYFYATSADVNTTFSGINTITGPVYNNNTVYTTSALGFNDVTTITATAPDGTTRNYSVSFVENKVIPENKILLLYSDAISAGITPSTNTITFTKYDTDPNSTELSFAISTGATLTIVGGNVSAVTVNNTTLYTHTATITLPSINTQVIVTSKDGVSNTYKVNVIDYYSEPSLSGGIPLDLTRMEIGGIRGTKIDNELHFNFTHEYAPLITGTGMYTAINLNQGSNVGVSIDGVNLSNYFNSTTYVNWTTNNHVVQIYTITGMGTQVLKTYTVKTHVQPKQSVLVGSENAEGLRTSNDLTDFYINLGGAYYQGTLSGSTFTINIPSNFPKNNLEGYFYFNNEGLISVPGFILSNGNYFDYDYTNPVPCVAIAEDGSTRNYTLVVNNTLPAFAGSKEVGFQYININDQYLSLNENYFGNSTIVGNTYFVNMPFGTNLSKARFEFYTNGNSLQIANYGTYRASGFEETFDMTVPLTVTSIAADGVTSKTIIIKVNAISPANDNTDLRFETANNIVKVIKTGEVINLLYRAGQDFTQCAPRFRLYSDFSSASVLGNKVVSQQTKIDFTNPVIYTVQAQSGATKNYTVTAAVFTGNEVGTLSNNTKIIEAYVQNASAVADGYEQYAEGRNLNGTFIGSNINLTVTGNFTGAKFPLYLGELYSEDIRLKAILLNGVAFNGGVVDFTNPVVVTAVAQDNSTQNYTIFVNYTANGVAFKPKQNQSIVGFVFPLQATVTGLPITFNATATSGLAVNITSSDMSVASITGNSILFLKQGVVTITATQLGNNDYNATSISAVIDVITVSGTLTGIATTTVKSSTFSIYPNPTTNGEWKVETSLIGSTMYVYNAIGVVVYSQKISSSTTFVNTDLTKGMYFVKVDNQTAKLIIE
ncbi:MAG: T9SS C-terminal target domain-containing protein [Bacteroidetes bacterium]|nr:MAG: T9SS C-terminal target domain-containing protein [Bacteroidota bacterium]